MPPQAYFRINAENAGQFERTLIIADEGVGGKVGALHRGLLGPGVLDRLAALGRWSSSSRSRGAHHVHTTIQNWSSNVYNLVTKRARAEAEAHVEWIDGNIGSRLTMKYPSVYLMGPKASGEVLSSCLRRRRPAPGRRRQDVPRGSRDDLDHRLQVDLQATVASRRTGARCTSDKEAYGAKAFVRCDALILDEDSTSETKPYMEIGERDAQIGHEATVSKVGDDQLFYLMSRGLSEAQATSMIVNGFIEPVTRTLPMEYAVEWSRLIELQMEGSVG